MWFEIIFCLITFFMFATPQGVGDIFKSNIDFNDTILEQIQKILSGTSQAGGKISVLSVNNDTSLHIQARPLGVGNISTLTSNTDINGTILEYIKNNFPGVFKDPVISKLIQAQELMVQANSGAKQKIKEYFQLLKDKTFRPSMTTPEVQEPLEGARDWTNIWTNIKKALNNFVLSQAEKPDVGANTQGKKDEEHSLLQNIQSGRVRGPVHVYGRHSQESSDE